MIPASSNSAPVEHWWFQGRSSEVQTFSLKSTRRFQQSRSKPRVPFCSDHISDHFPDVWMSELQLKLEHISLVAVTFNLLKFNHHRRGFCKMLMIFFSMEQLIPGLFPCRAANVLKLLNKNTNKHSRDFEHICKRSHHLKTSSTVSSGLTSSWRWTIKT